MSPHPNEAEDLDPAFEVHPSVLFRLGEELIQDEVQAIAELVKNCYDANSPGARVQIEREISGPGGVGVLRVGDTGEGMTEQILRKAFLTLADSPKRKLKDSGNVPDGKRMPLGDKGLGRLGAQRLGRVLRVRTRPALADGTAQVEHEISIDWRRVAEAELLSQVRFPISTRRIPKGSRSGTDLEISGLRNLDTYDPTKRRTLQSQMVRLVSPFGATRGFRVTLTVDKESIDLYSITKQILDAAVLKYKISYGRGRLRVTGRYGSSFFPSGTTPEERRARESLVGDGGQAFIDHLNAGSKRKPPFVFHPNDSWFASRTFEVSLADLSPDFELPPVELELKPGRIEGVEPAGDALQPSDSHFDANPTSDSGPTIADPGPFASEVFMVFVQGLSAAGRDSELRDYVRDAGGIRIYREGFAINVARDWLGLDQGATSSASSYGLRSGNVLGYVDLTVAGNPRLVEATDREAFVTTPHLANFMRLFQQFSDWADSTQGILRRQFRVFGTTLLAVDDHETPTADSALRGLSRQNRTQKKAKAAVRSAQEQASAGAFGNDPALSSTLDDLSSYVDEMAASEAYVALLRQELASLRDQIVLTHEAVAVGLSAETLAHEVVSIADRLLREAQKLRKRDRWSEKDARHLAEVVEAGARSLSKQASYLSPTLRYRREDRSELRIGATCEAVAKYHTDRMTDRDIAVRLNCVSDFSVRMNRGRLTQVLDNLILNSEYWILQGRRHQGNGEAGEVLLTVDSPRIAVTDTGPGISPDVEGSIFDPFTTTKPRGLGRGLGLFIARQLLEYSGGTIELGSAVNSAGRRDTFQIDLAGAMK